MALIDVVKAGLDAEALVAELWEKKMKTYNGTRRGRASLLGLLVAACLIVLAACDSGGTKPTSSKTEPNTGCVNIRELDTRVGEPTAFGITTAFVVTDCKTGKGVSGLTTTSFTIEENGKPVDAIESASVILSRTAEPYLTIVLDNTPTVRQSGATDAIADGAIALVENLSQAAPNARVAVIWLDIKADVKQPFTNNFAAAKSAIEAYKSAPAGTPSTNLYGGLVAAVELSKQAQQARKDSLRNGVLTYGNIVVFTDGADNAAISTLQDAQTAVAETKDEVQMVGFKHSDELEPETFKQLGNAPAVLVTTIDELKTAFATKASQIASLSTGTYVLGYCTPKAAGTHTVTIRVPGKGASEPVQFDASKFQSQGGPACGVEAFQVACDGVECGGLWCGGCSDTCNAQNVCECSGGKAGANCDTCLNPLKEFPCDKCLPLYTGAECDQCADPKFTGPLCAQCADPKFTGPLCDQCADPKFTGPLCAQCADPKFTGPLCAQCVDQFTGPLCDQCADQFTGPLCDQCADPKFTGPLCDQCADDGDLAILIDDGGSKKVVCAHDYPAWGVVDEAPKTFTNNGDGTVSDSKTGLMWQLTTSSGSEWAAAKKYCDDLSVGSKKDWRLPTQFELESLVDFAATEPPSIAAPFASTTNASGSWSATPVSGGKIGWVVDFKQGDSIEDSYLSGVRCVRSSGSSTPVVPANSRYEVNTSAKTVFDKATGLTWQREPPVTGGSSGEGRFIWADAKQYCEDLELGAQNDWRLPGIVELRTLVSRKTTGTAIADVAFPNMPVNGTSAYWSATSFQPDPIAAWLVGFVKGTSTSNGVNNNYRVRCVR
jgi:hypothetical protein